MNICPHCGCDVTLKDKKRSTPQLRRFFAVIRHAFANWPHSHAFQPKTAEHLRYWLEVQAGPFDAVTTIRCDITSPEKLTALLTAVLTASDDMAVFVEATDTHVLVKKALSISYSTLAHMGACALFQQVEDVIKAETGIEMPERDMEAA